MSVREYIGARYVPIFVGDWDNTKTYEPLSIVQNAGASYTSRQYVPAGIAINNTDYWALTGNYNAQVESYRQDVLAYNGRITALEQTAIRCITPEMYGAVGDGITDDTQAFEDMLDDLEDYGLVLITGKTYRITSPLTITQNFVRFTGLWKTNKPAIKFDFADFENAKCLMITGWGNTFSNLLFMQTDSATGNYMIYIDSALHNYNVDMEFSNCTFFSCQNAIAVIGRNIHIHECLFSTITANSFTVLAPGSAVELRGYRLENNRFHIAGWLIDTQAITTYDKVFNFVFKGNFVDMSRVIYTGISDNVCIEDNVVFQPALENGYLIRFYKTLNKAAAAHVSNNFVESKGYLEGGMQGAINGLIQINAACQGIMHINGNTFVTEHDTPEDGTNKAVMVISQSDTWLLLSIINNVIHTQDRFTPIQITNGDGRNHGIIACNTITTLDSTNYISASGFTVENNITGHLDIVGNTAPSIS